MEPIAEYYILKDYDSLTPREAFLAIRATQDKVNEIIDVLNKLKEK